MGKLSQNENVADRKKQECKDILVSYPNLVVVLKQLSLFNECQLQVHPVIEGSDLSLQKNISEPTYLKFQTTYYDGDEILY